MLVMVPYLLPLAARKVLGALPAAAAVAALSLLTATSARAAWLDRHEAIMGTNIDVEVWHDDPAKGNAAIDAVMDEMRRIDLLMSHYKPGERAVADQSTWRQGSGRRRQGAVRPHQALAAFL